MQYDLDGRHSRKTQKILDEIEKEELQNRNEWSVEKTIEWIKHNYHSIILVSVLLTCCLFNLDVRKGKIFPFRIFGVSLLKYMIVGQMNLVLVIAALFFGLLDHFFVDRKGFKNILGSYSHAANDAIDSLLKLLLNRDPEKRESSYYSFFLNPLYSFAYNTTSTGTVQTVESARNNIYEKTVFIVKRMHVLLLWMSMFWSFVSLSTLLFAGLTNSSMILGNFSHFSGVSSSFSYNLLIRAVPFFGVLYDRIALKTTETSYFSERTYIYSLAGYGGVLLLMNLLMRLSEEVWPYHFCDYITVKMFFFNFGVFIIFANICSLIVKYIDKNYLDTMVSKCYRYFMENGTEGLYLYLKKEKKLINTFLSALVFIMGATCLYVTFYMTFGYFFNIFMLKIYPVTKNLMN